MAIIKNSVIPIDMSIAAMSKVESLRAFSGKIRKWIYSLLAFMLKVYVFGIQKLSASWEMEVFAHKTLSVLHASGVHASDNLRLFP